MWHAGGQCGELRQVHVADTQRDLGEHAEAAQVREPNHAVEAQTEVCGLKQAEAAQPGHAAQDARHGGIHAGRRRDDAVHAEIDQAREQAELADDKQRRRDVHHEGEARKAGEGHHGHAADDAPVGGLPRDVSAPDDGQIRDRGQAEGDALIQHGVGEVVRPGADFQFEHPQRCGAGEAAELGQETLCEEIPPGESRVCFQNEPCGADEGEHGPPQLPACAIQRE